MPMMKQENLGYLLAVKQKITKIQHAVKMDGRFDQNKQENEPAIKVKSLPVIVDTH